MVNNRAVSRRKRRRHPRPQPEPRIPVVPSQAIEERIAAEVRTALDVAMRVNASNLLSSGYLVSAIYYHDGLLDKFNVNQRNADPADRIVGQICRQMPPGIKRTYAEILRGICASCFSELGPARLMIPVSYEPLGRSRAVHPFAIDLFVAEGTPVRSATRGVVVLAESEWSTGQWFSTSSVRGGNAVIVFDADGDRFLRYAHLQSVTTRAGVFLEAGDEIGAVGHTGFNAARKGHGRHLHFEINRYDERTGLVKAVAHDELEDLLEAARTASGASLQSAPSAHPQSARERSRSSGWQSARSCPQSRWLEESQS
jgi:murein DD-endopeptidase MepM/ murein hydrolase activator NlpD